MINKLLIFFAVTGACFLFSAERLTAQPTDKAVYLAYFYTDVGAREPENERIVLNQGVLYAEKTGFYASRTQHKVSEDSLNVLLSQAARIAFEKYKGGKHNQVGECFSKGTYKVRVGMASGKKFELEWDLCKVPKHWDDLERMLDRMKTWVEWR